MPSYRVVRRSIIVHEVDVADAQNPAQAEAIARKQLVDGKYDDAHVEGRTFSVHQSAGVRRDR